MQNLDEMARWLADGKTRKAGKLARKSEDFPTAAQTPETGKPARKSADPITPVVTRVFAEAPFSAYGPVVPDTLRGGEKGPTPLVRELAANFKQVIERLDPKQRPTFYEALADLDKYNLMQPETAMSNRAGATARRRQASAIAGGFVSMFGSVKALLNVGDAYKGGMMQIYVNERRSVIRPEMVTVTVGLWGPKALLDWRAHEWRYKDGLPYLWLMLPPGKRIHEAPLSTVLVMFLPDDPYRAHDAAVYAQRTINRMVSDNALDFADVDEGGEQETNRLLEMSPYLLSAGIVIAGFLVVLLNS